MNRVNKHMRTEYLAGLLQMLRSGTVVEAHVLESDSRHLITFYNTLEDSQVHGFPTEKGPKPRVEYVVRSKRVLKVWVVRGNWLHVAEGVVCGQAMDGEGDDGLAELKKIVETADVI